MYTYSVTCPNIRVCPVNVCVGVVAEGMLVHPSIHGGTVEEIVS